MDPIVVASAAGWARRHWKPLAGAALAVVVLIGSGLVLAATQLLGAGAGMQASAGLSCLAGTGSQGRFGIWKPPQMANAAIIASTGAEERVPAYGLVIAVATAMQESSLINLPSGPNGSLGLFQQRPAEGWGTPAQIMNPVYAAAQFFTHLLAVPGWQQQPLTVDAQAVQRSGHPDAYQKWQGPAVSVVTHLAETSALTAAMATCSATGVATGTSAQLQRVLAYAFAALGTSYDFGGSCTDPHSPDPALHCDCSSLVQQSFLQAGLHLPRTAEQQWEWAAAGHAQIISPAQAQTGDMIYAYVAGDGLAFPTMGHTGIIIDPARQLMIDAPHTGADVRIESYAWMLQSAAFHIVRYLVLLSPQLAPSR